MYMDNLEIKRSEKEYRLNYVVGGRLSGKSHFVLRGLMNRGMCNKMNIVITHAKRYTKYEWMNFIRDFLDLPENEEFKEFYKRFISFENDAIKDKMYLGKNGTTIREFELGSKALFQCEGNGIDIIWVDDAEELSEKQLRDEIFPILPILCNHLWISFGYVPRDSYLNRFVIDNYLFLSRQLIQIIKLNYKNNNYLTSEELEEIRRYKANCPDLFKIYFDFEYEEENPPI